MMKTPQAAAYVGLSKSSLDKFRMLGKGPAYLKIGAAVRYQKEDLDSWLDAQRRVSTWANDNGGSQAEAA